MDLGYLASFSAGVLSVVSPCVIPLIPIIVGHSLLKRDYNEILFFTTGFFLVFAVITLLTGIFTLAIAHYLFYFRIAAAILIILMGIVFMLNKNTFNFSYRLKHENKRFESLIAGILTCVAWSPCYGPYIVAVAAYSASTGNWFYSVSNMILYSLGFSFSIFILALLISRINIERFMKHYSSIRMFSGAMIIIAGIYLLTGYL
ncbi:MAG: cytochrome c biogenesis protein CcdA [Methanobacterium sp.]|nr:cytochrome c biogenesis protein CcdA [Methanobacterium sp.]